MDGNKNDVLDGLLAKAKSYTDSSVKTASESNSSSIADDELIRELRKQADEAKNTNEAKSPETHKPQNDSDDTNTSAKPGVDIKSESEKKDENVSTKKAEELIYSENLVNAIFKVAGISGDMSKTASEEEKMDRYDTLYNASYSVAREIFKRGL